jgi:hypothetical protein
MQHGVQARGDESTRPRATVQAAGGLTCRGIEDDFVAASTASTRSVATSPRRRLNWTLTARSRQPSRSAHQQQAHGHSTGKLCCT